MPGLSAGDTTPQMMVLGLVIQEPDTIAGIGRRFCDQFAVARWSKSSAHNNIPVLLNKGFVRVVKKGPPGEPSRDCVEATPEGIEHFKQWIRSTKLPPAIRDALQCKLELLEREDLAALLQLVREEEEAYAAACDIARARVLQELRSSRRRSTQLDWRARLGSIRNKDEANLWGMMSKRLEHLGDELERLLNDIPPGTTE